MSDPRSTYPKATAWTFLLDTPAEEGGASGAKAPPPGGGGGRPRLAAAGAKAAAKKKPSLGGSSSSRSCSGPEEMGAACSKSNATRVANKENMAELEEMLVPNGGDPTPTRSNNGRGDAECSSLGADSKTREAAKEGTTNVSAGVALDSTAFLSPEPEQELVAGDSDSAVVVAVENGIAGRGGGHVGSNGDERMRSEDTSAWIARNLDMLPRGAAVEVDQLKQVRRQGTTTCFF